MSSLKKWIAAAPAVLVSGTFITLAMPSVQAMPPAPQLPTLKPADNLVVETSKAKVPHTISQVLIPTTAPILADPPRLGGRILRAAPKPVTNAKPLRAASKPLPASKPIFREAHQPLTEFEPPLRMAYRPLPALDPLRSTAKPFSEQDSLLALRVTQKPLAGLTLRDAPKPVSGSESLRSAPRPIPYGICH